MPREATIAPHRLALLIALAASVAGTAPQAQDASSYANPHAAEPIGKVEQVYGGDLMSDLAVSTFRNIDHLFPTRTVEAGGQARELPPSGRRLGPVETVIGGESGAVTLTEPGRETPRVDPRGVVM